MGDQEYTTLAAECHAALTVQRSKFLSFAAPADTRAVVQSFIKRCGAAHPDATHCCWAYRTGFPDHPEEHSSDAGEPSGTAGRPIAAALAQAGLHNVVTVVVRYFGGVKLGIRGLIDAYHDAAVAALAAGAPVRTEPMSTLLVDLPYASYATIVHRVESLGGSVKADTFGATVTCRCRVPRQCTCALAAEWRAHGISVRKCE